MSWLYIVQSYLLIINIVIITHFICFRIPFCLLQNTHYFTLDQKHNTSLFLKDFFMLTPFWPQWLPICARCPKLATLVIFQKFRLRMCGRGLVHDVAWKVAKFIKENAIKINNASLNVLILSISIDRIFYCSVTCWNCKMKEDAV